MILTMPPLVVCSGNSLSTDNFLPPDNSHENESYIQDWILSRNIYSDHRPQLQTDSHIFHSIPLTTGTAPHSHPEIHHRAHTYTDRHVSRASGKWSKI